jgi:hypothetical protein
MKRAIKIVNCCWIAWLFLGGIGVILPKNSPNDLLFLFFWLLSAVVFAIATFVVYLIWWINLPEEAGADRYDATRRVEHPPVGPSALPDFEAGPLDRIEEAITEAVLNCRPQAVPEGEFPSPDDNSPLGEFDVVQFTSLLGPRFALAVEEIAAVVGCAQTVRELNSFNAQVGAILGELHEDILAEVLRQHLAAHPEASPTPNPTTPPKSRRGRRGPAFPGSWARKYRRMRAAGS